ncbi:hypothetical protein NC651_007350 [Populus alba x Populus x berolinensis]|nr:hypothetical protein NC651_007350 [Populus alba x Populus x berolinensis]
MHKSVNLYLWCWCYLTTLSSRHHSIILLSKIITLSSKGKSYGGCHRGPSK